MSNLIDCVELRRARLARRGNASGNQVDRLASYRRERRAIIRADGGLHPRVPKRHDVIGRGGYGLRVATHREVRGNLIDHLAQAQDVHGYLAGTAWPAIRRDRAACSL